MIDRIDLWVFIAGTAADALLLARVLQLRLPRTYLYITLACIIGLFFDAVQLWFGIRSEETQRIFLYSRFLYAFLYPLAAWDVIEEMKGPVLQLRRVLAGRLVTGLLLTAAFGFILSLFLTSDNDQPFMSTALALVLWAGASSSTLGFLWSMQRGVKAQQLVRPHNTFVWMTFYQLILLGEVVSCLGGALATLANATVETLVEIVINLFVLGVTIWCIASLKRVSTDVQTELSTGAS
ncbi:MAG TPA: hypothetical protein VH302_05570 [Bryobacteraceae bacterium]|nr:hypothetical protein [Bryobacteraceae bacterium]